MVALARLAFDLALPTEDSGSVTLFTPDREEAWVRRLFEKAILGFARVEFEPLGYVVRGGVPLQWQFSCASAGLPATLPRMLTDIVLDAPAGDGRLIIDTKFTSVLGTGRFGDASLKSGYLYQMYAYLRSQEGRDLLWEYGGGHGPASSDRLAIPRACRDPKPCDRIRHYRSLRPTTDHTG
jgi:5-methylcytosine-specific restriction enzyme subunit McrC